MTAPFTAGTAFSSAHTNQFATFISTPTSAGDDLVLAIAVPAAGLSVSAVTDSQGNTYTQQALETTNCTTAIYTATGGATAALGTTDFVQVSFSTNTTKVLLALIDCASYTAADQAGVRSGTGSALSVSSAGITAVPGELAVAVMACASSRTFSSPSGTLLTGSIAYAVVEYQTQASAATATATVTASASTAWAAALVTLEPAVTPAAVVPRSAPSRGKVLPARRGRSQGQGGTYDQAGPVVYPLGHPAGLARTPPPVRKGRAAGLTSGAPVSAVQSGPAILPQAHPAGLGRRAPGPARTGRGAGMAGAPVTAVSSGPPVYALGHPAGLGKRSPGPVRTGRGAGSPVPLPSSGVTHPVNTGAFMAALP